MNRQETLSLLSQFDIRPTRSLGQNFLTDDRIISRICEIAEITPDDLVLEIGPGIGGLTRELAHLAGQVIAVEIDRHVLPALESVLAATANTVILHADALKTDLAALAADWTGPVKVVANLPYYITTPLLEKILCELPGCSQLVMMIQDEAADRVMAQPGSKQYGPLAILAACFGETRRAISVPAASFYPKPGVDSCVIRINSNHQLQNFNYSSFLKFLENCFAQRRKTLVNNLKAAGIKSGPAALLPDFLAGLGLAGNIRAEMLGKDQFIALYQHLYC